ncbi:hypothetical protein C3369_13455 [Escherichia sp. ESNIH1]|nr:hypothetical protein C3369_13455 [Escherichia sp. ESNIH1]
MYTPESILFPYIPPKFRCFCLKSRRQSTQEIEQRAPGGGLYDLRAKAQGSFRIFIRSFTQIFTDPQ